MKLANSIYYSRLSNVYTSARFYKLDIDEVSSVAHEQEIRAMPTFLIYKDGKEVERVVGSNEKALQEAIKKATEEKEEAESS